MARRSRPSGDRAPSARGQTGIDFLVGMGVFLLAVGFVFGFAPGLFEPFAGDTGTSMVAVDRGAAALSEDVLVGSSDRPGVLNDSCTVAFFDDDVPADCRFDTVDLNDVTGLDDRWNVNVTVEDGGSIVTLDSVRLAAGDAPDPIQDVIVSKRIVRLDGTEQTLVVRVW